MKRRFLATALALVMIVGMLPAGILTISAEPLEVPSCDTLSYVLAGESIVFEDSLLTATGSAMIRGNDNTSISLDTTLESADASLNSSVALSLKNQVTDASEKCYVLNMQIDKMPVFADGPTSSQGHSSTGFYIQARRPDVTEYNGETFDSAKTPFFHLAIVRMDETGNLGFAVKNDSTSFTEVTPLGVGLRTSFELAIRWLDDYSLEVYCNDVLLKTYSVSDVAAPGGSQSAVNKGIRIGYNSYGSTADSTDGMAVKLTVNSVSFGGKYAKNHTPGKNGVCTVCGAEGYMDYTQYEISKTDYPLANLTLVDSGSVINKDVTPVTITQSVLDTTAYADNSSCHYFTSAQNPFETASNGFFLIQDIQIDNMPVYTSFSHPSTRAGTGYYVSCPVDYNSALSGKEVIKLCVYRIDGSDNLYIAAGNGAACSDRYPLGVTLGQRFTLMAHCKSDGNVDVYCNDVLVHTFASSDFASNANANNSVFRLGYYSNVADASIAGSETDIKVYGVSTGVPVAHENHTGGTATCSKLAECTHCGTGYGELSEHTPGKNGVCTVCGAGGYMDYTQYEISKTDYPLANLTLTDTGSVINKDVTPVTITQTTIDTTAYSDAVGHYLTSGANPFETVSNGFFLIQDIRIDKMPVYTTFANANTRAGTGYYVSCPVDYESTTTDVRAVNLRIYRIDGSDNLYLAPGMGGVCGERYPLGVTLGQRFTLMAHCKPDGNVDVYCNDVLVHTFASSEFSSVSGSNRVFRLGYYSNGADGSIAGSETDIKVYGVSTGVPVAHVHTGGTATCSAQAICEACGTAYGATAPHTEKTASTCTTKAVCSVCDQEYGLTADHTPDAEGNCSVCSAAINYIVLNKKDGEDNYTDISIAAKSPALFPTINKYGVSLNVGSITQLTSTGTYSSDYSAVLKNMFTTNEVVAHVSQTITITSMPAFDTASKINAYTANGYYNNLRRNEEQSTFDGSYQDNALYCIAPDSDGNLNLWVLVNSEWTEVALNRELGDTFRLTTVWHENGSLSFYCDGGLLGTYANATYGGAKQGNHTAGFTMGYSSYGANVETYGNGTVNMSVSNIVISDGHYDENDDGSCFSADTCTVCGIVFNEAKDAHVQADDDGNCVTPIYCGNPGCKYVFVEGHTLTHVPEVPATDDATGTKEHWKCEAEGCEYYGDLYLDEAGTQKVTEGELVISKNFEVSGDKATVSPEYVDDVIAEAGDGDVALVVPTPELELPAAALDALVTSGKPLVITTGEGKVTLNPEAIAAINTAAAENALSINVKKAGAAVLEEAQTNKLLESYTAIKDVITAEMMAGTAITSFGEGAVTIEIPFIMDNGTVDTDYKLVYISDDANTVEVINNARFEGGKVIATLTHFSDYAIVSNAAIPEPPIQGSGTITSNGGSAFATVTGTYVDGIASGDVFSVDVEWDNLSFNYMAANTWDPETHTHTGGGWEEDVTGNVTVTNHSNIAITVTVTKEDVGGEKGLGVDFKGTTTDNLDAGTTENTGDLADKFVVEFAPKGTLTEGDTDVTLATITVTITKYVPQN